jgi:hypothetical protein
VSTAPLDSTAIARFAAAHAFKLKETLRLIKAMTPEQRGNVAAIYQDDSLLSEDERTMAYSMQIRMEMREMKSAETRSAEKRCDSYVDPSDPLAAFKEKAFRTNHSHCTKCHPELA